jgi:SAM-dependent methyltransferase
MNISLAKADSLERIIPDELQEEGATGKATLALHMERYRFAAEHLQPGTLLDLACGVGYGTQLLADGRADLTRLTGVDLNAGAIEYATDHYVESRTTFVNAEAFKFLAAAPTFDNIVSLETVEHMADSGAFLSALVKALKPGGMLVSSVPTTPSMDGNPHHLNDFTDRSFRRMGEQRGLVEVACFAQRQPFDPWAILSGKEKRVQSSRRSVVGFYVRNPNKLVARCWSTVRHGFENRYLTIAWKKRFAKS